MYIHRFISRLPVNSRTYAHSKQGRETARKKNRLFCAAVVWEQKTNGGSYIREKQNERERGRKRTEGQQERRETKGKTLGDGEVEKNSETEGAKE